MKASSVNLISWTASLAITAGLGFYVYTTYGQLQTPPRYTHDGDTEGRDRAKKLLRDARTVPVEEDVRIGYANQVLPTYVGFNWTGVEEKKPDKPIDVPQVVEKKIVKIEELLDVIYFQVDTGDAGGSRVLVKYKGDLQAFETAELRVADVLPQPHDGIAVVAITTDSMEFSFTEEGRENEVFRPGILDDSVIFRIPEGEEAREQIFEKIINGIGEVTDLRPKSTNEIAKGVYVIGTEDSAYLAENYQSILSKDVRTRNRIGPDGKRAGVEILEVAQGSFAQRHGVARGDVVISINGYPVNSEQEAIQWAKDNGEGIAVFEVVMERLGRLETLTYRNPDKQ